MIHASTGPGLLVAFDVGNTTVKCAARRPDGRWERLLREPTAPLSSLADRLASAWASAHWRLLPTVRCVMSSVCPAANQVIDEFWRRTRAPAGPEVFGRDVPVPIRTLVRQPDRVGTDRLLQALAARMACGAPCIVVCAGTAITVDLVDPSGAFAGGAIGPGFRLAAEALHAETALLPLVGPARPAQALGADTREAVQSGVYWFCVGGVQGLVRQYRALPGCDSAPVVCTGADAELLLPALTDCPARHEPDLIFQGMAAAIESGG